MGLLTFQYFPFYALGLPVERFILLQDIAAPAPGNIVYILSALLRIVDVITNKNRYRR
jgi:hypothetical protein